LSNVGYSQNVGYSGTPLFKKLGIKESSRLLTINAPEEFWNWVAPLPDEVEIIENTAAPAEVMVLFVTRFTELENWFSKLESFLARGNRLWVAYPKKSAKVATDLNFDVVQSEGLALGIVDVKICAISEVWSGVCFMRRKS
jgi:hypothetical protein